MAGYTRNDTGNNIADGNVINASDLDGEHGRNQSQCTWHLRVGRNETHLR